MKTITNITHPAFALFALACFALSPQAGAVCQEGCLTNQNTILGDDALLNNTSGSVNTAIGFQALNQNTTGNGNTATGIDALYSNTTGGGNTATGIYALFTNTTGFNNTANGSSALYSNTTGHSNTANGVFALIINTTGEDNTATGFSALYSNTSGRNNTANGQNAMRNNTSGSFNVALGDHAGFNLTTGSNNIEIGNRGVAGEAGTIRIGKQGTQTATYIAGIGGATVPTGVAVIVDSSGHLGTTTSSARYKDAIKPMDKASEAVLALQPVTFRYKHELDPNGIPQFGLVAEDVEKVNPDLVARDKDGKPYSVRYEAVNAMLLNEFLKEHRTVQELKSTTAKQEATIARQQKQIEALTAGLQEVKAQVETSLTPQTVVTKR
jgi:Chaperone of endosialidase